MFWEIIEQLQTCDSTEEKCTQLITVLESFSAADIKRFQKVLTEKHESLYPKLWKRYIQEEGNHQPLL